MFLLSRHKRNKQAPTYPFIARALFKIDARTQAFAHYLQNRVDRFSKGKIKVALALFFFSSASLSAFIIVSSISKPTVCFMAAALTINKNAVRAGDVNIRQRMIITRQDFRRINDSKSYADSVNRLDAMHRYKRALQRKGLQDTLKLLQTIPNNQQKEMSWKEKHAY